MHVEERKRAEERATQCECDYEAEKEVRISTEKEKQRLMEESERSKLEMSNDKSRIRELEAMLEQQHAALESCKNELSVTSEELDRTSFIANELQSKLLFSEERVSHLTVSNQDAESNLDDTCAKLIKLSCIYQYKEVSMNKVKNELRAAVIAANKHADTAISKYDTTRQENKSLRKKLDEVSRELKDIKAHRAEVQRQRKHAPISYINQLHSESTLKEKRQRKRPEGEDKRKSRAGKENSFVGR